MRGVKTPPPTKEQVKAARKAMSAARKVISADWKNKRKKRKLIRIRQTSSKESNFYTWKHDFETLLERSEGKTPEEVIAFAEAGADRMALVVNSRNPGGPDVVRRYGRGVGSRRQWLDWQERFDQLLHFMCRQTTLSVSEVISRAEQIADLAGPVLESRRPKRKGAR
jgi:hypothetical protein